jgi:SulP family sulfate permease
MDATGLNALEDLYERLRQKGKSLILSAPHTQPLMVMERAGFLDQIGRENVCANVDMALARAREILHLPPASNLPPKGPKVRLKTVI